MTRELALATMRTHPLVGDRARLDGITDTMAAQIHRVIHGRGRDPRSERALHGGESADDILQEALIALLEYDPARLRTTWEALSVGIARKKAFAALRRATRGRRREDGDGADEVTVVAIDPMLTDIEDESAANDPETVFEHTQQQLVLARLARERLSGRDLRVFVGIHFNGLTRAALAEEVGLTPQGVGQLYVRVVKALYDAARAESSFPASTVTDASERRTP